jgi:nitrile hydratase beta subunit
VDGIHDLGGMSGFGSIEVESDEPVFHHPWEARAFALNVLSIGVLRAYNADEYRHSVERMDPAHYLAASYYERVLTGVATLLVEKGLVTREDLEARAGGPFPLARPVVPNRQSAGSGSDAPRFAIGDSVLVRNMRPAGHTRVPRYCRGQRGTVLHVAPPFTFPDDSAHGGRLRKEHTYHVEFDAACLWDESAGMNDTVVIDLWETYLEAAP